MAKVTPVIVWEQHSPLTQWWGSTDCQPGLRYGLIASYWEMHSALCECCWHTVHVDNQQKSHVCSARFWHPESRQEKWLSKQARVRGSAETKQHFSCYLHSRVMWLQGVTKLSRRAKLNLWFLFWSQNKSNLGLLFLNWLLYFEKKKKASREQSCHKSL